MKNLSKIKFRFDRFVLGLLVWAGGSHIVVAANSDLDATENRELFSKVNLSYQKAEQWLLNNFRDKGLFVYRYDPISDHSPDKNNALRQLMASRLLAELSQKQLSLDAMHQKNLDFIFKYWYRVDDQGRGYIYYSKKSKLGANAMALRTLVSSPFFDHYQIQAQQLADGIVSLMQEAGNFKPWFIEPDYDYDADYLLTFYSGEAILSLLEYYEKTQQADYLTAARKAQHWYLDHYVDQLSTHYYPAYVPWHTLSLSKLYEIEPQDRYAQAIFRLNDELIILLDKEDYPGRFYNKRFPQFGQPHSSSDGVYTESLVYAYALAQKQGDALRLKGYGQALSLAFSHLLTLQYNEEKVADFLAPEKALGAFRIAVDDPRIRIDTTQHAMEAFRTFFQLVSSRESFALTSFNSLFLATEDELK